MRMIQFALMLSVLAGALGTVQADEPSAKKREPGAPENSAQKQTYLGVGVEALPQALASQLSGIVPKGQGLLVLQVAKDSPAAKAGLLQDDILLTFGDHKLSSPQELIQRVHSVKAGDAVAVAYVRNGKLENCKVILGDREAPNAEARPHVFRLTPNEQLREMFEESESTNGGQAWDSLDAMKLTRIDANHWRAEIDYRGKDGKKEHKSFEGTRHEIRKGIHEEKDMPLIERHHLLRALSLHNPVFEFHLPPFGTFGPDF